MLITLTFTWIRKQKMKKKKSESMSHFFLFRKVKVSEKAINLTYLYFTCTFILKRIIVNRKYMASIKFKFDLIRKIIPFLHFKLLFFIISLSLTCTWQYIVMILHWAYLCFYYSHHVIEKQQINILKAIN